MDNPDVRLAPTETRFNIGLGGKMMRDLVEFVGRQGGRKKDEIKTVLGGLADTVQKVWHFRRDNVEEVEGLPYLDEHAARHNFQSLTGEERALAAEYAVVRVLKLKDDSEIYKSYELNRNKAVDKGRGAGLTNLRNLTDEIPTETGQLLTGTTESRMLNVEEVVRAILLPPPHPGDFLDSGHLKEHYEDMVLAGEIDDKADMLLKSDMRIARESMERVTGGGKVRPQEISLG